MIGIRQIVREIHRRSIWQVLSVYLVGSWGAFQVVETVTEIGGLPDWVPAFAVILLVIGLPVVLATAVVQEGVKGPEGGRSAKPDGFGSEKLADGESGLAQAAIENPGDGRVRTGSSSKSGKRRLLFTWRNAIAGGIAAFSLLGILVAGYFLMWSTGIEGDAVVLAEFENTSDDETLGGMVTEALRVDLAGSSVMTLVEPGRISDALRRMGKASDEPLDAELALEVAIRDGFKAVVHGTVGSAGSGYLFVASMQAAESGAVLATFREAARGPDEVIDAIDKLSQDIREKAGESLRVIKSEEPLEKVSTSSLEALRKYAEADRLADQAEYPRAISVLREAIDLDPTFAMAYRRLAVLIQNSGGALSDQVEATTRAYELRDRLTERERFLAVAYFHNLVTLDVDAEIQAYETVLERYPDDRTSLNNIALALSGKTRLDETVAALERAVNGPGASASAITNLPGYLAQAGRHEEAEEALARLEARYPGRTLWKAWVRYLLAAFRGDAQATREASSAFLNLPEAQGGWRSAGHLGSLVGDAMAGNLVDAQGHARDGLSEMRALGDWSQVLFLELNSIYLELLFDREEEAKSLYSGMDLNATLDSISPPVRDYQGVLRVLSHLGEAEAVQNVLEKWQSDQIPSSSGPVFEEARRAAEAVLTGRIDPGRGLEALNDLSRELNCPGCYLWTRARFAEEAERWEEAKDLFLAALRGGSDDFIGEPLQRILAHERLGRAFEALGRPTEAMEHYTIFVQRWSDADGDLQPRVEVARARISALEPVAPSAGEENG
jgi:tetratricopeptide (TPR) repeat protein